MERHRLQPLSEEEKKLAEENHNLIYTFLYKNHYRIDKYYHICIFGYLKAIQAYCRIEAKRKKYKLVNVGIIIHEGSGR